MKSSEPAPLSPRLASASSEMWFEIHLRRHKLALTDQVGFVLLQDETVAGVRGTEGGRGRVASAVRALCSAALTAVQALAWDKERWEGIMGWPVLPGLMCNMTRRRSLSCCKMCIFTQIYCRLWVLVWKVPPDFYSYLSPNFFMACCGPRLSGEALGAEDKFLIVLLFSHLASYIQLYLNW